MTTQTPPQPSTTTEQVTSMPRRATGVGALVDVATTGQVSTPRPGKADKTVMGASGTGSYEVTPPRPFACRRRHRSSRPILPRTANIASVSGGSHPASGTAYILILTVSGQVRDAAQRVFSYDFARLDDNERTATDVITGPFAQDHHQQFTRVRELAPPQQAVVLAT